MVENHNTLFKDIVVILQGITGSVLQKNGKDTRDATSEAISSIALSRRSILQVIKLEATDYGGLEYGNRIKATRFVSEDKIIPGLVKILDGYSATSKLFSDDFVFVNFKILDKTKVVSGDIYNDPEDVAANFYHFPYNWHRDNKINAQIFNQLINKRLKDWREFSDNKKAKVILLSHSMAALIYHYYLKVLVGWQDYQAVFIFGTPDRVLVNVINFLVNGLRKAVFDLTKVMILLPSVYQLLPIYSIMKVGDKNKLVADVANLPHINQVEAQKVLKFHSKIELASGQYRIMVQTDNSLENPPNAVCDLFKLTDLSSFLWWVSPAIF